MPNHEELFNTELQLQSLMGSEPTPASLGEAINVLDTQIRRGIPQEAAQGIAAMRAKLINQLGNVTKLERLKRELSAREAPGRLGGGESIVPYEQTPIPGGMKFSLPAGETRMEKGGMVSSGPWAGSPTPGGWFGKAIVADNAPEAPTAPQQLTPDLLFRLKELGMEGMIPQLQPERGPAITEKLVQELGEAGIPAAGITHASQVTPEQFKVLAAKQAEAKDRIPQKDAGLWVDNTGKVLTKVIGESAIGTMASGGIRLLNSDEAKGLRVAVGVLGIGDELRTLAPGILKQYKGATIGQIFDVQGNRLVLKAVAAGGEPNLKKFVTFLNDYLISLPQAFGIPGSREGIRLIEMFRAGTGTLADTVQSINASLDANAVAIDARWTPRGIRPSLQSDWTKKYER